MNGLGRQRGFALAGAVGAFAALVCAGCIDPAGVRQGERSTTATVPPISGGLDTVVVQHGDVSTAVALDGRVDVDVIETVRVPLSGIVSEVHVRREQMVAAGDVLFTVVASEASRLLALELEAARAAVRLAALDIETTESTAAAAERRLAAAEMAFRATGLAIDTPLPLVPVDVVASRSGVVATIVTEAGSSVMVADVVVEIGEPTSRTVRASFDPSTVPGVEIGAVLRGALKGRPGEAVELTVVRIETGPVASTVFAAFANANATDRFVVGEQMVIEVAGQLRRNVLWVPPHVIRRWDGRDAVIVRAADGATRRVEVIVGLSNDTQVEVAAALQPGDVVLVP